MATINLAPSTHYIATARKRRRNLYILTSAIVIVMIGIWVGLTVAIKSTQNQKATFEASLASVETEIAKSSQVVERINAFEDRLTGLDQLLASRTSLTPFFQSLEQFLPPATTITHLVLSSKDNAVTVEASAPSLDDIAQAVASLNRTPNETFKSMTIEGSQRVDAKDDVPAHYDFSLQVQLQPRALATNRSNPS
jgi:Tfp pilus assembly protein PilN